MKRIIRVGSVPLRFALTLSVVGLAGFHVPASGQEAYAPAPAQVQSFQADLSNAPPEVRAKIEAQMKARGTQMPPGAQKPGDEKKPTPGDKKPEGDKSEKKEEGAPTVKRPAAPTKANPEELKAKPDKDGMVQFSFYGQPWTEVLQWYAEVANCSLDWQEMPADFLNLTTQRRYTVAETRDLLNSRLLSRGFTMIRQGDVLSVVKLDKIDPSLVPRVEPDDLEEHLPFDFARVRFALPDDMDPAKAVEDVKILLNPSAKVTPLLASKQLMVIDAVSNLRDVRDLLYSQQLAQESDVRPKQFQIRYRRADYVAEQVMVALGLDPTNRKVPMEVQMAQQQQRMQMMQQMQQQQHQQGGKQPPVMKPEGPQVHIAVDVRRNTMSVNAPPKEMKMIERIISQFDVPEHGEMASAGASGGLTLERYQTVTVDPEAVISALKEIGNLNPLTQLKSDSGSKTIFATATREDHETIRRMVGKLDGTGRGLRVVWLSRRTRADEVAGTVQALMVGEEKKSDSNRSRYFFYDPWYRNNEEKKEDTGFRIQADVENNRLLLWCNDNEYAEVTTMLEQLGAIASAAGKNPNTWRVLETRDPKQTAELVERLKQSWNGKNPLNINVAPQQTQPLKEKSPTEEEPAGEEAAVESDRLTRAPTLEARGPRVWLAQFSTDSSATSDAVEPADVEATVKAPPAAVEATPAPSAAPINITVTPDGRILVSSQDIAALDQIEDLLNELEPKQQDFAVFKLLNSRAVDVHYNLKEYFQDELADDDSGGFYSFFSDDSSNDPTTLGKRRKMRFIWDPDSNTILVQNASPAQLETIRKLIQIYDQPTGEVTRRTEIIQIKYSKANDIAAALKEVYRDLLSSKDKEFQDQRGGDRRTRTETYYRFYGGSGGESNKKAGVKMAFEGALSIGVDQVSNSLIISAEEQIFANVRQIVQMLDEEAKPNTVVQVHQIEGSISAAELRKALATALSSPWPGGKPENAAANAGQGGRQGGDSSSRGDRDGDRRRWRDRDRGRD